MDKDRAQSFCDLRSLKLLVARYVFEPTDFSLQQDLGRNNKNPLHNNQLLSSAPCADAHEADSAARRSLDSAQQRVASGSLRQRLLAGQDLARVIKHLNDRADQVAKETAPAKIKALTVHSKLSAVVAGLAWICSIGLWRANCQATE